MSLGGSVDPSVDASAYRQVRVGVAAVRKHGRHCCGHWRLAAGNVGARRLSARPASSGQTVICTGVDHDGFVAGAGVNNLDVRVRANATVHDNGVVAIELNNRNTVDNKGTIDTQAGSSASWPATATPSPIPTRSKSAQPPPGFSSATTISSAIMATSLSALAGTAMFGGNANTFEFQRRNDQSRRWRHRHRDARQSGGDTVTNNGAITGAASTIGICRSARIRRSSTTARSCWARPIRARASASLINDHTTLTNNNMIQVGVGGEGIEADGATTASSTTA